MIEGLQKEVQDEIQVVQKKQVKDQMRVVQKKQVQVEMLTEMRNKGIGVQKVRHQRVMKILKKKRRQ